MKDESLFDDYDQLREEILQEAEKTDKMLKAVIERHKLLELTRKPSETIALAKEAADQLFAVIEKNRDWVVNIEGRDYLRFPAWQLLASFFQLYPSVVEVKELRDESGKTRGFEARAVVRNRFDEVLTEAVARCDRDELIAEYEYLIDRATGKRIRGKLLGYKKRFDEKVSDHIVLAIAQTRAMRRALQQVLSFVVVLARYEPVVAEEVEEA